MADQIVLTRDELKAIVRESVHETLVSLGIDSSDPIEVQKDFAHLRAAREAEPTRALNDLFTTNLREGSSAMRRTIFGAVLTGIVTFVGSVLYLGWQAWRTGPGQG